MTYHKLYNVLGQLSAILTRALKSNTHPWLRVYMLEFLWFLVADVTPRKQSCIVTLSQQLNYTQTAIAKGMLRRRVLICRRIWCMLSSQKYPPEAGRKAKNVQKLA